MLSLDVRDGDVECGVDQVNKRFSGEDHRHDGEDKLGGQSMWIFTAVALGW